jgi:hypothetical protein
VSALIAARDLMSAARLRKDADVDVLDVGARDRKRNEIFRLARGGARMTTDTARVVNYLGPLNRVRLFHHRSSGWKRDYNITLTNPARRNKLEVFRRFLCVSNSYVQQ